MTDEAIIDMFDNLNSTRVKLRLRSRRLWSIVATSKERAAAQEVSDSSKVSRPVPPTPDDDIPSGGLH